MSWCRESSIYSTLWLKNNLPFWARKGTWGRHGLWILVISTPATFHASDVSRSEKPLLRVENGSFRIRIGRILTQFPIFVIRVCTWWDAWFPRTILYIIIINIGLWWIFYDNNVCQDMWELLWLRVLESEKFSHVLSPRWQEPNKLHAPELISSTIF